MRKDKPTLQDLQKEIAENTAAILRIQKAAAEAARDKREAERKEQKAGAGEMSEWQMDESDIPWCPEMKFREDTFDFLWQARHFCGIRVIRVHKNLNSHKPDCLFDAIVVTGKYVFVVGVNITLKVDDVGKFIDRQLPLFSEAFPEFLNGKQLRGAMIFQRAHKGGKAARMALDAGVSIFRATTGKQLHQINEVKDLAKLPPPVQQ